MINYTIDIYTIFTIITFIIAIIFFIVLSVYIWRLRSGEIPSMGVINLGFSVTIIMIIVFIFLMIFGIVALIISLKNKGALNNKIEKAKKMYENFKTKKPEQSLSGGKKEQSAPGRPENPAPTTYPDEIQIVGNEDGEIYTTEVSNKGGNQSDEKNKITRVYKCISKCANA